MVRPGNKKQVRWVCDAEMCFDLQESAEVARSPWAGIETHLCGLCFTPACRDLAGEGRGVIFGLGTDLMAVNRVLKVLSRGREYLETLFTENERDYCEQKAHKCEHYAARYAAKEAFFKALGTGWRGGLAFSEVEVVHDELGKPGVILHGKVKEFTDLIEIKTIHLSLSHTSEYAMAVIILEK